VHYPFDVLAGALLGVLIGLGAFRMLNYFDTRHLRKEIAKTSLQKPTPENTIIFSLSLITFTLAIVSYLMLKYKIPY
jgi:membrane-associated phospholipid phosphatase